jgi:acyl-CoA synthetase (AMP-forming)/AMP-acid ligase II
MMAPAGARLSLLEQLDRSAALTPADVVVRMDGGAELTYGDLHRRACRVAGGLAARGIRRGDLVAAIAHERDWPAFVVACYGIYLAGGCALPLSARRPAADLRRVLEAVPDVVLAVDCAPGAPAADGRVPLAGLEAGSEPLGAPVLRPEPAEPACVVLTSGSSGEPVMVTIPWGNVDAEHGGEAWLADEPRSRLLISPAVGTMVAQTLVHDSCFGVLFLVTPSFDPDRVARMIEAGRPTHVTLVPATASILCRRLRHSPVDVSSVRMVVSGSAHLPPALFTELGALFPGAEVYNSYGLTEGGSIINPLSAGRPGALGRPEPDVDVRVIDDQGHDVPVGSPGDLLIRDVGLLPRQTSGPVTADRVRISGDGWIHTGDRVYADDDGYLYLVGRSTEIVDVAGRNVPLPQVEDCLAEHPAVDLAAVVPVPHELLGNALVGVVQLGGPAEPGELLAHCAGRLPESHRLQRLVVTDRIPLNLANKIDRRAALDLVLSMAEGAARGAGGGRSEAEAPDALTAAVIKTWEDVLELRPIGPDDRLGDLGAHSLLCLAVTLKLRALVGRDVPVTMVLTAATPAALAADLATAVAQTRLPELQTIPRRYDL